MDLWKGGEIKTVRASHICGKVLVQVSIEYKNEDFMEKQAQFLDGKMYNLRLLQYKYEY